MTRGLLHQLGPRVAIKWSLIPSANPLAAYHPPDNDSLSVPSDIALYLLERLKLDTGRTKLVLLTGLHDDPHRSLLPRVAGEARRRGKKREESVDEEHMGDVVHPEAIEVKVREARQCVISWWLNDNVNREVNSLNLQPVIREPVLCNPDPGVTNEDIQPLPFLVLGERFPKLLDIGQSSEVELVVKHLARSRTGGMRVIGGRSLGKRGLEGVEGLLAVLGSGRDEVNCEEQVKRGQC